jgi:SHAQKYF class myb-like DNA-binding protein
MKKHYPFFLQKEKNFNILIQKDGKANKSNNSLSRFNIIKINSYINLDTNTKKRNYSLTKEGAIRSSSMNQGVKLSVGRWTKEEHIRFLKGLIKYGCDWNMVHKIVKTISRAQARSHAQKYFIKMKKILKSKIIQYNLENLLNCTFNLIINFNGGQPMTVNQKKRMLNIIISNFQGFERRS